MQHWTSVLTLPELGCFIHYQTSIQQSLEPFKNLCIRKICDNFKYLNLNLRSDINIQFNQRYKICVDKFRPVWINAWLTCWHNVWNRRSLAQIRNLFYNNLCTSEFLLSNSNNLHILLDIRLNEHRYQKQNSKKVLDLFCCSQYHGDSTHRYCTAGV